MRYIIRKAYAGTNMSISTLAGLNHSLYTPQKQNSADWLSDHDNALKP